MEEEEDWGRKRTGGGTGLGEVEDWGRNRTGGGTGILKYLTISDWLKVIRWPS